MAAITAAVGLGLAAVGVGTSIYGSVQQNEANEKAIAAQQQAEAIRLKASEVDANRRRRQFIREGIISRAQALATTTAQGAAEGSALPGAYGQIGGRTAFGISGVDIAQATGQQLYGANQSLLQAKLEQGEAQTFSQIGQGLTTLGGAIVGNVGAIDRVFGNATANGTGSTGPSWFGRSNRSILGPY